MAKVVNSQGPVYLPSTSLFGKAPKQLPFALAIVTAIGFILASILIWKRFPLLGSLDDMWAWASLSCGGGIAFLAFAANILGSRCQTRTAKIALEPDPAPKKPKLAPKPIKPRPIITKEVPPLKPRKKKPAAYTSQTPAGYDPQETPSAESKKKEVQPTSSPDQSPVAKPKITLEEKKKKQQAREAIKEVNAFLRRYTNSPEDLTLEEVTHIRREWEVWEKSQPFNFEPPPKEAKEKDPRVKLDQKIQLLRAIQDYYDLYYRGFDENWFAIKKNGDCLFESFVVQAYLHNSSIDGQTCTATSERKKTVDWIREHYPHDLELQQALTESMDDHYSAKNNQMGQELSNLATSIVVAEDAQTQLLASQQFSLLESQKLDTDATAQFLNSTWHNFTDLHRSLLPEYLKEMEQGGTFGSSAELYALCKRHEVCAEIYYRDHNTRAIIKNEGATLNREALQGDHPKPVRSFLLEEKHYSPYFPSVG